MTALFEDGQRVDPSVKEEFEGEFAFLARVRSRFFEHVRIVLNTWFERYPDNEREELRERLFSLDERASRAAFWELLLHELYTRASFSVAVHPHVEGTDRKPDFLLEHDGDAILLEARLATGARKSMLDGIKFLRDECRLLSLTHDADAERTFGCCWARPRMWEQYADAHRGVRLLFDGDLLDYTLATAFSEHNVLAWQDEVRYTPAGISGSKIQYFDDARIFDPEQRADAISAFIEDNSNDFFFLKSDDFETEHEYRAVVMPTDGFGTEPSEALSFNDDYAFVDYGDALVAVIVGE